MSFWDELGSVENYARTPAREDNLLLYLESCCVDGFGQIDLRRVNAAELNWLAAWDEEGFITFEYSTARVTLSDAAWRSAHRARREKAARMAAQIR